MICKRLKVLTRAGHLQLIQNLTPSVALGRQCCIRISQQKVYMYTKSVENLLNIGSQLLSAMCYIPSCQSRKTREHVFFLSSVLIVQVSPSFLRRKIVKEAQSR